MALQNIFQHQQTVTKAYDIKRAKVEQNLKTFSFPKSYSVKITDINKLPYNYRQYAFLEHHRTTLPKAMGDKKAQKQNWQKIRIFLKVSGLTEHFPASTKSLKHTTLNAQKSKKI